LFFSYKITESLFFRGTLVPQMYGKSAKNAYKSEKDIAEGKTLTDNEASQGLEKWQK